MKIGVLIATRGKPQQVVGLIESARMLATGEHELEFLAACDDDDPADSYSYLCRHAGDTHVRLNVGPRPISPSTCWNDLAKLTDADALVTLPDDRIIATPMWDGCINWAWRNHDWAHADLKVAGLRDSANPGQPTMFVVSPRWIELTGELFDARYAFWWADTAIAETYSFITGQGLPILPIETVGKHGEFNPRLRKMALWWAHYGLTRKERLATAHRIREELDLPVPMNLIEIIAGWEQRDRDGLPASEEIVRQIDKPAPLDARYLECERAAIEYIRSNGGPVFEPSTHDGDRF